MDAVKISRMGTHTMVAGSDRRAVEAPMAGLIRAGASQSVSKVEPLRRNWIVTLETPPPISDDGGCKVVRMGLQTMVTGLSKGEGTRARTSIGAGRCRVQIRPRTVRWRLDWCVRRRWRGSDDPSLVAWFPGWFPLISCWLEVSPQACLLR